jgi:hypothetical protein
MISPRFQIKIEKSLKSKRNEALVVLVADIRKKSNLTCALDSGVDITLMLCASAGNSSGKDLTALADELAKLCGVLVIDIVYLVSTEDADLLSLTHLAYGASCCVFVSIHLMKPPIVFV